MGDKTKNKNGEKRKEKKILTQIITFYKKNENQQAILKKCQEAKMEQKKLFLRK
jgi:hypothetical protein